MEFLMRAIRVIAEEAAPHRWTARFASSVHLSAVGESPHASIQKLIDRNCPGLLDIDRMSPVNDASRDGHLEFDIPVRDHRCVALGSSFPKPSTN